MHGHAHARTCTCKDMHMQGHAHTHMLHCTIGTQKFHFVVGCVGLGRGGGGGNIKKIYIFL